MAGNQAAESDKLLFTRSLVLLCYFRKFVIIGFSYKNWLWFMERLDEKKLVSI